MKLGWKESLAVGIGLLLIGITMVYCAITIEVQKTKLQAIEAICYSNAYEQVQMWPILDIIDGELGEE